ncbi:MAG TPA: di-heme oxidoredictase family protein [Polyangiales bacterium]|nr:di-heme oxidoredictase family protein [Polyangiales bacterium]
MRRPRSRGSVGQPTILALLALAGCAGHTESEAEGDAGASPVQSQGASPAWLDASAETSGPKDLDPPVFRCGEHAPRAFSALCTGCHRLGEGQPFPDLLAFDGSEAQFLAQVRSGGNGMPAFSSAAIDDATVAAIFASLKKAPTPIALGNLEPLFADKELLPISTLRSDGVLVTRGAGRVRGRHELEGSYGPFHELYFEDRTFGFVIEDYTAKGESKVVVTYLPVARPTDGTNFRAWKIYGDGNVFHANTGMDSDVVLPAIPGVSNYASEVARYARTQQRTTTNNARTGKPLQKGDLFEFEFGVFIDKADVRANSRTAYYTDTYRYRVGLGVLTPDSADASGKPGPHADAQLGGGTSTIWAYAEPELYLEQMALNIQHEHVQPFVEGRRLFHTDFQSGAHSEAGNPVFSEQANKRGPLFVSSSCTSCHPHNGGGRTLSGALSESSSMTFKLYGGSLGSQLQLGEASAKSAATETRTVGAVTLKRPSFDVGVDKYSPRIARRLVGLGLLEAIDETTLLAQADPDDCDGDGISGRPQLRNDPETGAPRVGRFGWRAEKVSLRHQVADALEADLGVTTRALGGADELANDDLERMVAYMRLLGVPPQRDAEDATVKRGQALFHEVGCANCHLPALSTGNTHPFVELRGQSIRPYTDLLLHDMGADLADQSGLENPREWRTPPLWGVGLSQTVQGYVSLLHDGRAASVLEAVLWHGGEAQAVRERVQALPADQRAALIRFVESL